jgi:hypothetical protein
MAIVYAYLPLRMDGSANHAPYLGTFYPVGGGGGRYENDSGYLLIEINYDYDALQFSE